MLLDDVQVALAEVDARCRTAAARYADAADMVGDAALAAHLRALCSDRERFAARLESEMRALDVLPRAASSEAEDLQGLATRVKVAVTGEEARVMAEAVEAAEREMEAAVSGALRHDVPAAARRLLEELRDTIDCVRADLATWKQDR